MIKKILLTLYLFINLIFDSSGSMPTRTNPFRPSNDNIRRDFFRENLKPLVPNVKFKSDLSNILPSKGTHEKECFIWEDHINRIQELNSNKDIKKVDYNTIMKIFCKSVMQYYNSFEINNYVVFYNTSMFDIHAKYKVNGVFKTNLEIMKSGYNPFSLDGDKMTYHHLIKADPGPLVMLSGSFHQKFDQILHPKGWGTSIVNRKTFNKARKKINKELYNIIQKNKKNNSNDNNTTTTTNADANSNDYDIYMEPDIKATPKS